MLEEKDDKELIRRYLVKKEERAAEVLVRRHYNNVFKRFLRSTKNEADAHDLCQQLWLKIIQNLPKYSDQGKFVNYLNTSASNMMKDHWKSAYTGRKEELDESLLVGKSPGFDIDLDAKNGMYKLVSDLIPKLPIHLRLPFLLKHESEYWEDKNQLRWHHLAELNGLQTHVAGRIFHQARDKLIDNTNSEKEFKDLSDDEQLMFLVWTQAQRADKKVKMTEQYFARLMGIPLNTFKTRYRAALKELQKGLEEWN